MGSRDNSKILAAGMASNMPAIADPMKSESYERERKQTEKESKQAEKNLHKFQEKAEPVNQALKAGSKKEDLFIATKRFRQNDTAPPCKNCVITFKDCKFLK